MSGIKWFESLASTNNEAKKHIADYDNLSVIATIEQSAGRGQGSHTWYTTPGKNLTFTIVFNPENLPASEALYLTRITTLSLLSYLAARHSHREHPRGESRTQQHHRDWPEYKRKRLARRSAEPRVAGRIDREKLRHPRGAGGIL